MLEFDAYQRSETVSRILKDCLPNPGSRVLDVGGYPGRLRALMPEYDWVICDPLVDAPGDQVIGDASRLPFGGDAFEMSVSLDVLEHIPPKKRRAFVHEISRVSQKGFILSFPYAHPLVESAETSVREMYENKYGGKTHPWLEEHKEYGVPHVDEIISIAEQSGLYMQKVHVGAVHRWQLLQCFGVLLDNHPAGIELAPKIDAYYQEQVYPFDFVSPSYRVILIGMKDGQTYPFQTPAHDKDQLAIDMELQTRLMQATEKLISPSTMDDGVDAQSELSSTHVKDYISRLETGVRLWEDTCVKLNQRICEEMQWRNNIESNVLYKLLKQCKRLFKLS